MNSDAAILGGTLVKHTLFAYVPKLAFSVLLPFNLLTMLAPSAGVSATASTTATDLAQRSSI